ncbi:MAG: hypothetical protein ACTS73_01970 [Arsenophonus sp. NEOnobi-MAG3]
MRGYLLLWVDSSVAYLMPYYAVNTLSKSSKKSSYLYCMVFSFADGVKITIAITVLVIAIGIFKGVFIPLSLTYLGILIIHIITPVVIK